MLKRAHFKNWRSLRDVVLDDLGPITVLIGANSSGKTNIVEGLEFLRRFVTAKTADAAWFEIQRNQLRSLGAPDSDRMVFEIASSGTSELAELSYRLEIEAKEPTTRELMLKSGSTLAEIGYGREELHGMSFPGKYDTLMLPVWGQAEVINLDTQAYSGATDINKLWLNVASRWQIVDASRVEPLHRYASETAEVYLLEKHAGNAPSVIEFMEKRHPAVYAEFRSDLEWLLGHILSVGSQRYDRDLRVIVVEENRWDSGEQLWSAAPTISSGTARIIALLAAYHALDMRAAEEPGLIIVDEPDASLNPGILGKLVELLRNYSSREGRPRQFILTTHNPAFLNYFQPDEVRIVSRDDQGYTRVDPVPERVKKVWLDDGTYALGEVWDMGAFGVPAE